MSERYPLVVSVTTFRQAQIKHEWKGFRDWLDDMCIVDTEYHSKHTIKLFFDNELSRTNYLINFC